MEAGPNMHPGSTTEESGELARRRQQLGELVISIREFSLFLTESVEAYRGVSVASDAETVVMITLHLDGPTQPRDLARASAMTTGGITNLLDRIEKSGLVRRRDIVDGDQRGVLVELTEEGSSTVERYSRMYGKVFAAATPITDRWRALLESLGQHVGDTMRWRPGSRDDLLQIRSLEHIGASARTTIGQVVGPEDRTPWRSFHLLWLATRDDGVRPLQIGTSLHLSSAGTSDLISRIEQRGLVRRTRGDGRDGRAVVVTTTADGQDVLEAMLDGLASLPALIAETLFPT